MRQNSSYMVCATPRSGSTLLCEALKNTGVAGNPDEYFGPMHVPKWRDQLGVSDFRDYVPHVIKFGSSANGVFGVKIMKLYWSHFMNTLRQSSGNNNVPDYQLIEDAFQNIQFVWITRRNKIRQGVSWAKAMQGVPWTWDKTEPHVPEKKLEFQFDVIDHFIAETVLHEAAWQEFFTRNCIKPYVVVYEDFVKSIEETTFSILDYLDISFSKKTPFQMPMLRQQADRLSDEWAHFYQQQKELAGQGLGWNRIGY